MAARVEKDDEVGAVIAADSSASTEGFGVRRGYVKIVHLKIEVKLLRHFIVGPGRWLVIERELEVNLPSRAAGDRDPLVLNGLNLPAEQSGVELGQSSRIVGVEHHALNADLRPLLRRGGGL